MRKRTQGFTIVELLIVIVIVAILAAIVIVAYNGIQARARDNERQADVRQFAQIMEVFYVDNGYYPPFNQGGVKGVAVSSWRNANLSNLADPIITPPDRSSITLANTQTPTISQYGYHNQGTCSGSGLASRCTQMRIYWRSEENDQVRVYTSQGH